MELIGLIAGREIHFGAEIALQYFDKDFPYGNSILGKIVYYDFGYKIFDGIHYHRLDGFCWWNGSTGFKILKYSL